MDDGAAGARLCRVIPRALERRHRTGAPLAVPARCRTESEPPVEGAADAARLDRRHLPEPELLILDEPTSGLDPIVRREFIQTVIGAYQDGDPGRRTVFVSTHLISEFEGLIDEFTIIDRGRDVLTLDADAARERYQKIHVRLPGDQAALEIAGARVLRRHGKEIEMVVNGNAAEVLQALRAKAPEALTVESLTLEEIFVSTLEPLSRKGKRMSAAAGVLSPALTKEVRALLPTYAAALGSIAIGCVSTSYLLIALGLLGFAFGRSRSARNRSGSSTATAHSGCCSRSQSIGAGCSSTSSRSSPSCSSR